ncbi:hypothetical protein F4809DRAFT_655055 [Biscogniauxia mediterranea]|nr:hypothetical protein F4809DRAFT_655055 [Biscogniauxia mediterranea]
MHIQLAVTLLGLASTAVATYSPEQLNNLRAVHDRLASTTTDTTTTTTTAAVVVQAPRQVSYATLGPACASSALAIVDAMPYATGALALFLDSFDAAADDPTNLCAVTAALPASLRAPYTALDRQASAWYAAHSAGIQRLLTSCGSGALGAQLTRAVAALQSYTAAGCEGPLTTPTVSLVLLEAAPTSSAAPTASSAAVATTTMPGFVGGLPPNTTTWVISSSSSSTSTTANNTTTITTDSATAAAAAAAASATTSSISQDAAVRPTGVLAGAMAAAGLLGAVMML